MKNPDGTHRAPRRARCTRPHHGSILTVAARAAAVPVDARDRVGDGRRERRQLPLPQPLLRGQPGAERRRAATRSSSATRACRGSTRSRPTPSGNALYADISVVPNVTNEKAHDLQHGAGARDVRRARPAGPRRLALVAASGARTPTRSSPASSARRTCRSCSATTTSRNSNDSYWLSNPEQPLEGFDRIIGDERTERSLRTRSGLRDGGAAAGRRRRPARQPVHASAAPGHRVRQPPVRGRAVARRAGELLRGHARRWSGRAARST